MAAAACRRRRRCAGEMILNINRDPLAGEQRVPRAHLFRMFSASDFYGWLQLKHFFVSAGPHLLSDSEFVLTHTRDRRADTCQTQAQLLCGFVTKLPVCLL